MPVTEYDIGLAEAAALPVDEVLLRVATSTKGLTEADATARRAAVGVNAVQTHRVRWDRILLRQLRSPLLVLLAVTSFVSYFVGERSDAVIIGVILTMSVGLGFMNEFRAEKAAAAMHSRIRHSVSVIRDGHATRIDVVDLVPGDIVDLQLGEIVAADIRLFQTSGLECDESILTGESMPISKGVDVVVKGAALADFTNSALMGTVVHSGAGRGVVVATGSRTEFGKIAVALGMQQPETPFQAGLRRFSSLLLVMAGGLTTFVFVANLILHRPLIDGLLFSLAIAVGITPQLLPAVVSTSLAAGSRDLARRKVLVKRLISIEDLGDVEVLFTDKTGTLTDGRISFMRAIDAAGQSNDDALRLALLSTSTPLGPEDVSAGENPLDQALWESTAAAAHKQELPAYKRLAMAPFDHERRMISVLIEHDGKQLFITKGAPESVMAQCSNADVRAEAVLRTEFEAGSRVVAVATRDWSQGSTISAQDEHDLSLVGFLIFLDAPKSDAGEAIKRLSQLKIDVKIITGDNALVAVSVCKQIGVEVRGVLSGPEIDALNDEQLHKALEQTTIFARVAPEQKARIVRSQRSLGSDVAFLGDGVNDAIALHEADVGISVDSATDVAKDAADIVLLEKDLNVLADGVVEGRRIFANTIKYVLMGASSNFGNMFSAAGASAVLSFLPMLPSQILLNNLLYDASQLAISSDSVDEEQLARPSHWDIGMISRYMLFFGPLSSIFDFGTFAIMLMGFHAKPELFRTAWFVESLATQTLVIFVIRTRRSPFYRSHPSLPLLLSALAVVLVGTALPYTPIAHSLGFKPLSGGILVAITGLVIIYLGLVEIGKRLFFHTPWPTRSGVHPHPHRQARRRVARFTTAGSRKQR